MKEFEKKRVKFFATALITAYIMFLCIVLPSLKDARFTFAAEADDTVLTEGVAKGDFNSAKDLVDEKNLKESDDDAELMILAEDESKRSASAKHFLLSDGTYLMVDYGTAVHYQKDDEWLAIDNTFVSDNAGVYKNKSNSFEVSFSEIAGKDASVEVASGGVSLSMSYVDSSLKSVQIQKESSSNVTSKSKSKVNYFSDSVQFESSSKQTKLNDALNKTADSMVLSSAAGFSFEYLLRGNSLKENIVLDGRLDSYVFEYRLNVSGGYAELDEDGGIAVFSENGDQVFSMPKGFMFDAEGAFSDDVKYELISAKESYILRILPDESWINASERAFPVTIDPTVTQVDAGEPVLKTLRPANNIDGMCRMTANSDIVLEYGYLQFSATTIANATIKYAYLSVFSTAETYIYTNHGTQIEGGRFSMNASFLMGSPNFLAAATASLNPEYLMYIDRRNGDDTSNVSYSFAATKYAQLRNAGVDCGIILYPDAEANYTKGVTITLPGLYVYYTYDTGINPNHVYEQYDFENIGTGYVSTQSDQFVYHHTVFEASMGALPFAVTASYDSKAFATGRFMGQGWTLNLHQRLEKKSANGYIYYDKNNRPIFFTSDSTGEQSELKDTEGLNLTLTLNSGTSVISDVNGNKLTFNSNGCLTKISDNFGHSLQIAYTTMTYMLISQYIISTVTDSNGDVYSFTYTENKVQLRKYYRLTTIKKGSKTIATFNQVTPSGGQNRLDSIYSGVTGQTTYFNYVDSYNANKGLEVVKGSQSIKFDKSVAGTLQVTKTNLGHTSQTIDFTYSGTSSVSSTVKDSFNEATYFYQYDYYGRFNSVYSAVAGNTALQPLSAYGSGINVTTEKEGDTNQMLLWQNDFDTQGSGSNGRGLTHYVKDNGNVQQSLLLRSGRYDEGLNFDVNGREFVVSAWAYSCGGVSTFSFGVWAYYSDGSVTKYNLPIIPNLTGRWQLATTRLAEKSNCTIVSVAIEVFVSSANNFYIDDIRITKVNRPANDDLSSQNTYNSKGQLTSQKVYNSVTGNMDSYAYTYDNLTGNLMQISDNTIGSTIIKLTTYSYTYHTNGAISKIIERVYWTTMGASQLMQTKTYEYNEDGTLSSYKDPNEIITTYGYNNATGVYTETTNGVTTTYQYDPYTGDILSVSRGGNTDSYTYNSKGYLTQITSNTDTLNFVYDATGRITNAKLGNQNLATYAYDTAQGYLNSTTYGNGQIVSFTNNSRMQPSAISYDGGVKFQYNYDAGGNLTGYSDYVNSSTYRYNEYFWQYGSSTYGEVCEYPGGYYSMYTNVDPYGNVISKNRDIVTATGASKVSSNFTYEYNSKYLVSEYGTPLGNVSYAYNGLGYLTSSNVSMTTNVKMKTQYSYTGNQVTGMSFSKAPSGGSYSSLGGYSYEYYDDGKIEKVSNGLYRYEYDSLGRLVREDNANFGETYIYQHKYFDNLIDTDEECTRYHMIRYVYAHTTETPTTLLRVEHYLYYNNGWNDQLTDIHVYDMVNGGISDGYHFNYHPGGNLASKTHNGVTTYYEWTRGTMLSETYQLALGENNELIKINQKTFKYDINGLRTEKTVGGVTTKYFYDNGQLFAERRGNKEIFYYYDQTGVIGMQYDGDYYYFLKNLFGDIIEIYDANGVSVGGYGYDAYSCMSRVVNFTSENIADVNPFRYRGYYCDTDLGLYYLKSRYYDPTMLGFISPDDPMMAMLGVGYVGTGDLYAYCMFDPINNVDPGGMIAVPLTLISVSVATIVKALAAAAAVAGTVYLVYDFSTHGPVYNWARDLLKWIKNPPGNKGKSTDKPSWVDKGMLNPNETAQQNAERLMNEKYGRGNWNKGPGSKGPGGGEHNKILKWIVRGGLLKEIVFGNYDSDNSTNTSALSFYTW